MFNVSPEQLNYFKAEALKTLENEPELIDERIRELVMLINCNIRGVATVFSCSGHTYEELEERHEQQRKTYEQNNDQGVRVDFPEFNPSSIQEAHIVFVTSEEGEPFLKCFGEWVMSLGHGDWVAHRPELQTFRLMTLQGKALGANAYLAWKLQADFNLGQEGPEDAVACLRSFYDYVIGSSYKVAEPRHLNTMIDLTLIPKEGSSFSMIKLFACISRYYDEGSRIRYWVKDDALNERVLRSSVAPLHLMDFDRVSGRTVELRSQKNDELGLMGIVDKDISILYSRLGGWMEVNIKDTTFQGKELIDLIEPAISDMVK